MKIGILLSGGKDSLYSAYLASKHHKIACCITIRSENKESYMFHTPNIEGVKQQVEAMELPLIIVTTKGEKEKELAELRQAIVEAKEKYKIQGISTGAVASQYQASRIQNICHELNLWCINPLWQIEQNKLLQELLENKFEILIAGVFAYPFDEKWLGKVINEKILVELKEMQDKYEINPAGEGGEIETYVLDCPLFKKKIQVLESKTNYNNYAGTFEITSSKLIDKTAIKIEEKIPKEHNKGEVCIIDTSTKEAPLYFHEFIRPIIDICEKIGIKTKVINLKDISQIKEDKIIISGTALKDNNFLEHRKKVQELTKTNKSILGICAGAEMLLPEEIKLEEFLEIGPKVVEELNKDNLTSSLDGEECYFLHQLGIRAIPFNSDLVGLLATNIGIAAYKYKDKNIYGLQFHPEVSQKQIIIKFLKE